MKSKAGLWLDRREAVIVVMSKDGDETKRITSNFERSSGRSGGPSGGATQAQEAQADDSRQREETGDLARYYDEIISYLRDAESILIFGPGEAKGELKKRFDKRKGETRAIVVETADRMTDPQIVAQVRHHFHPDSSKREE